MRPANLTPMLVTLLALVPMAELARGAPTASRAPGDAGLGVLRPADEDRVATSRSLLDALLDGDGGDALQRAAESQREAERLQAAAEIEADLLYDPRAVADATARLREPPGPDDPGNIPAVCEALGTVDGRFAEAWRALQEERYEDAVVATGSLIDPLDATFLSAATHYVRGRALVAMGRYEDAADVYRRLLVAMPERISFAAAAAEGAAEAYEQAGRLHYALRMYRYLLANYPLALTDRRAGRIEARVAEFEELYSDPLGAVAERMDAVGRRLARAESDKATRRHQEQIVALLEDLIRTAEEQESRGGAPPQGDPGQPTGQDRKKAGQRQGRGQGSLPRRAGLPTAPARISAVVPGPVERPHKLSRPREGEEDSGWSHLPPREQERLRELRRKQMSERRREQLRTYRRRLAAEGSR